MSNNGQTRQNNNKQRNKKRAWGGLLEGRCLCSRVVARQPKGWSQQQPNHTKQLRITRPETRQWKQI